MKITEHPMTTDEILDRKWYGKTAAHLPTLNDRFITMTPNHTDDGPTYRTWLVPVMCVALVVVMGFVYGAVSR